MRLERRRKKESRVTKEEDGKVKIARENKRERERDAFRECMRTSGLGVGKMAQGGARVSGEAGEGSDGSGEAAQRRMKAVGVCIADLFPPTHSSWRI